MSVVSLLFYTRICEYVDGQLNVLFYASTPGLCTVFAMCIVVVVHSVRRFDRWDNKTVLSRIQHGRMP